MMSQAIERDTEEIAGVSGERCVCYDVNVIWGTFKTVVCVTDERQLNTCEVTLSVVVVYTQRFPSFADAVGFAEWLPLKRVQCFATEVPIQDRVIETQSCLLAAT